LTNIPAGKYFIGAGRLDNLIYYPGGTDRAKATEVTVEAAKITTIGSFAVPAQSKRAIAPSISSSPQSGQESIAYRQIAAERNAESKKKLMLNFEKTYPNSSRLAEVYVELSHTLASQTDFAKANEYAEKAVARVAKMKMESKTGFDQSWQNWVASLEVSAQTNLTWTKQMVAWQQKQIQAAVLGKR
jgi:hypothetical protein